MGTETSKELGGSLKFAMYSTDKYMPPTQGDYKTVTAVDGSKWYHQYAQPTKRGNANHQTVLFLQS